MITERCTKRNIKNIAMLVFAVLYIVLLFGFIDAAIGKENTNNGVIGVIYAMTAIASTIFVVSVVSAVKSSSVENRDTQLRNIEIEIVGARAELEVLNRYSISPRFIKRHRKVASQLAKLEERKKQILSTK